MIRCFLGCGTGRGAAYAFEGSCLVGPQAYCTAGVSASGCQASLGATGSPSATAPSGFLVSATDVEADKNGLFFYGANGRQFVQDLNALWSSNPLKNPGEGALVQTQLWYRDPLNTSNQSTSLSDAIEFQVGP